MSGVSRQVDVTGRQSRSNAMGDVKPRCPHRRPGLLFETGEFRFVSAGQPGPVHLTEGKPPANLEVSGFPPVGVGGDRYKEQSVHLMPADRLILYSDGLIGVRNAEGEHFGNRRLLAALDEGRRLPLADALRGLVRTVEGWHGDVPRQDDISVLLVERREATP